MASTNHEMLMQGLTRLQDATRRDSVATCIGCGCDDYHACWDDVVAQPCSWLRVDRDAARGVCSTCPEEIERWDSGDTTQAEPKGC